MAFPYIFESNFEQGNALEWNSETDVEGVLNFPHYSTLARYDTSILGPIAPYRGAYVAEWNLVGDTADHTLTTATVTADLGTTIYSRFYVYVSEDIDAAQTADNVVIYELQGAASVVTNAIGLTFDASANTRFRVAAGKLTPSTNSAAGLFFNKNEWHCFEVISVIANASGGSVTLLVDGIQQVQVASLTNIAVTQAVFGIQDALTTTTGHIYMDNLVVDNLQVYPYKERFPEIVTQTKTGHVFIGPGWLESASLLHDTGSLILYDTDTANTVNAESVIELDSNNDRTSFAGGIEFKRGCYAVLSTGKQAELEISTGVIRKHFGPSAHWSSGAIRAYGARRKPRT